MVFPIHAWRECFLTVLGHTGQTLMNERSSRSHAIFSITIECSDTGPDGGKRIRVGKLHMVDLAVGFLSGYVDLNWIHGISG